VPLYRRSKVETEYTLVAVKRRWVPELLYAMFKWVIPYQPFRWIFTRPV
jgi:hypothetical protein